MNEVIAQLKAILQAQFTGRGITTYFIGKQDLAAISNLPMCSVFPIETRTDLSGTIRDKVEYDLGIQIAVNVKNYLGATGAEAILATQEALINLIEQNNDNDGWQTNTVMGILKSNLNIGNKVIFLDHIKVKYDTYLNPKKFPVAFCIITFTAYDRKNRT